MIEALALAAMVIAVWYWRDWLFCKLVALPVAENAITCDPSVAMETEDGVTLVADIYRPRPDGTVPTILMRTPYGRRELVTAGFAKFFARRGYNVVVQDTRGAGDSGGTFVPASNEQRDGRAAVNWIKAQPWFNGQIATFGMSYLGYKSLAVAVGNDPTVKAVFSAVAPHGFRDLFYGTGGFNLEAAAGWSVFMDSLQQSGYRTVSAPPLRQISRMLARGAPPKVALDHLPIRAVDRASTGREIARYQTFIEAASPDHTYWSASTLTPARIASIEAPVFLASMWHDAALPDVLADYRTLHAAGKSPRLSIATGPHFDLKSIVRFKRNAKNFFDHVLKDGRLEGGENRVRLNVLGTKNWVEAPS